MNTEQKNAETGSPVAKVGGIIVGVVVVVAVSIAAYALIRIDTWGEENGDLPARLQIDMSAQLEIPDALLGYEQTAELALTLQEPVAITVGGDGRIYVAGDRVIEVLDMTAGSTSQITLDDEPSCLAVAKASEEHPGRIYVGVGQRITVYGLDGEVIARWAELDKKSKLTSVAVMGETVFVADAGQRVVLKFDAHGNSLGRIGQADPDRQMPGFIIPSPYFDLAATDDTLFVVNPGMRRVESYSLDGQLQTFWGQGGSNLEQFFGCCNPAHFELLPDGRFVTSEKGIPRVKVYSPGGDLLQVVAGPSELGVSAAAVVDARGNQKERVFDIAITDIGDILVLDARKRAVRVFREKGKVAEDKT